MNAHLLFSNNNINIYTALRSRLSALGIELYIVGMQERWSPQLDTLSDFKVVLMRYIIRVIVHN